MKRYIILMILIVSVSQASGFSKALLKKTLKNFPTNKIFKITTHLSSSKNLSNVMKKISLKKLTPIDKLANVAQTIATKNPINNKIMATKYPLQAMRLYSKGGDKIFKNIDVLATKTSKIDMSLVSKLKNKFPNIPRISKVTQKELIDKTIAITKTTGKFGVKVIKELGDMAIKHPKSAIAGVLFGWYSTDPEGFKEAFEEFGGSLAEFAKVIGSAIGAGTIGIASGMIDGIISYVQNNITTSNMIILIVLVLLYLVYKFRSLFNTIFGMFTKKQTIKRDIPNRTTNTRERKTTRKKGRY